MELLEIEARKDHLEPGLQSTVSTFSDFSIAMPCCKTSSTQVLFGLQLAAAIFKQILQLEIHLKHTKNPGLGNWHDPLLTMILNMTFLPESEY